MNFQELQVQLYDMSQQTFNGVSLFAQFANGGAMVSFMQSQQMHPEGLITLSPSS